MTGHDDKHSLQILVTMLEDMTTLVIWACDNKYHAQGEVFAVRNRVAANMLRLRLAWEIMDDGKHE